MIYSGSLYFGMVLSEGSTEHGGYHEALIGVGWVLGPTAGAITQWIWPGNVTAGVIAVGAVIGLSVLAVAAADLLVGRKTSEPRALAVRSAGFSRLFNPIMHFSSTGAGRGRIPSG